MQELALKEANILDNFMQLFEQKVILNEDAYIMKELMTDIKEMCEDASLPEPFENHTYRLKNRLKNKFGFRVNFCRIGKHQVVYKAGLNPCLLVAKTLEVAGLTDDASKAFARMVRQKLDNDDCQKWPIFPSTLLDIVVTMTDLRIHLAYGKTSAPPPPHALWRFHNTVKKRFPK